MLLNEHIFLARLTVPAHDINDISHKDDAGYHTPENVLR